MNQPLEFTGKDVNAAVDKACRELNLTKKELKYDVASTGTSGIFGIVGRKDARIRVTVPKEDATNSSEDKEGILSIVDEAFGQDTRIEPKKKAPAPKKSKPASKKPTPASKKPTPAPATAGEAAEAPADTWSDEPDISEDEDTGRWDDHPAPRSGETAEEEVPPVPVSQVSIDLGVEAVQKMADLITDDAHVEAVTQEDRLTLQITGGNTGILIGRKGQTLDAMQFLADKIINRQSEARVRVKVDIEGYMETRKANLRHLALKMAEKAKKTGRPATINQMSAQDRRIVHLALKEDAQVRTQSMGDGYYRRLVIFPKKRNSFRGKKRFKK